MEHAKTYKCDKLSCNDFHNFNYSMNFTLSHAPYKFSLLNYQMKYERNVEIEMRDI